MIRRPPRSTLFPTRRSSDLQRMVTRGSADHALGAGARHAAAASSAPARRWPIRCGRSEEHTSELQSRVDLVCRLLLEKKKIKLSTTHARHFTNSLSRKIMLR